MVFLLFTLLIVLSVLLISKNKTDIPDWVGKPQQRDDIISVVGSGDTKIESLCDAILSLRESVDKIIQDDSTQIHYALNSLNFGKVEISTVIKSFKIDHGFDQKVVRILLNDGENAVSLKYFSEIEFEEMYDDSLNSYESNKNSYYSFNGKNYVLDDLINELKINDFKIEFCLIANQYYTLITVDKDIIEQGIRENKYIPFDASKAWKELEEEVKKYEEFKKQQKGEKTQSKRMDISDHDKVKLSKEIGYLRIMTYPEVNNIEITLKDSSGKFIKTWYDIVEIDSLPVGTYEITCRDSIYEIKSGVKIIKDEYSTINFTFPY